MAQAPVISEATAVDRSSSAPTIPASGTRRQAPPASDYEGQVRGVLIQLGSADPDGDLNATRKFLEGCQDAQIDPAVCAANIYTAVKHKHGGGTILREASGAAEGGEDSTADEAEEARTGGVNLADLWGPENERNLQLAFTWLSRNGMGPTFGSRPIGWYQQHQVNALEVIEEKAKQTGTSLRKVRVSRGMVQARGDSRWKSLVSTDAIYAEADRRTRNPRTSEAAEMAPVISEGGSRIRQQGPPGYPRKPQPKDGILQTSRGLIVSTPPYEYYDPKDGLVHFVELDPDRYDDATMKRFLKKDFPKWKKLQKWSQAHTSEAAEEKAPAVGECTACIPWVKVTRDPAKHAEHMELAAKHGPIKTAKQVYALVGHDLMKETNEVFLLIPLNVRGELCSPPYEIARGQTSKVHVEAVDVIRAALDSNCESFIICHCHPTGKCTPSKADRELTNNIKAATKIYGKSLCMQDHVVVGNGQAFSIFEGRCYRNLP